MARGILLAGLTVGALVVPRLARAQAHPDFSGYWVLAPDESEDLRDKLQGSSLAAVVERPLPSRGARPRPEGRGARGPDPAEVRNARVTIRSVLAPVEVYHISQQRDSISFLPASADSVITVPLNGKPVTRTTSLGAVEIKAEWDDRRIKVERKYKDGPKVQERYALGLGGMRLLVDYTVDADGLPGGFAFRRVYRPGTPDDLRRDIASPADSAAGRG